MDPIFTLAAVFAVFLPALLLPGPDFVGVARASVAHGPRAGLLAALGVAVAQTAFALLSLVGLSAILLEVEWLAWAVRILGGGYLIYLGAKLMLSRPEAIEADAAEAPSPRRAFAFGVAVTVTNPKALVLFATLFGTAVTETTPAWLMGLMAGLVFAAALSWYAAVALFMSSAPVIRRLGRGRVWIERIAGACFVAIGGKIVADARSPVAG